MQINGHEQTLLIGYSVKEALDKLGFDDDKVVVEIDKEIILKEDYYKTKLKESNIVEVISFVGGG